jgi:hypothetical protein
MPDRRKILQGICVGFGAILLFQLAMFAVHATFSRGLKIPALPALPPEMEAPGSKANSAPSGTNSGKSVAKNAGTNVPKGTAVYSSATSTVAHATRKIGTNVASNARAHSQATSSAAASNDLHSAKAETAATNGTNVVGIKTNSIAETGKGGTNALSQASKKGRAGRSGPNANIADLPGPVKDRIDRITQGEILAPVMRPMPMGLLGIAGESAFLRAPDGQTGLVKEGDQLGTIKLLRIGTNRVLIEQDGEKKELMIFAGLGGESLLPKTETTTTNEPPKKSP